MSTIYRNAKLTNVTQTELGYLSGATGNIQDQLDEISSGSASMGLKNVTTGPSNGMIACAYNGSNQFVGVGNNETWYSSDGKSWTEGSIPAGLGTCLFFGNGVYVAGGASGAIASSANGTSFTARTAGGGYSGGFNDGAYGASVYVLVGDTGGIQSSPDGTTWTARTAGGGSTAFWRACDFNNSLFVICGDGGEIQTSPDGITWTARTADGGSTADWYDVFWDGTVWHIIASNGEHQTSPDGTTWTAQSDNDFLLGSSSTNVVSMGGFYFIMNGSAYMTTSAANFWVRQNDSPITNNPVERRGAAASSSIVVFGAKYYIEYPKRYMVVGSGTDYSLTNSLAAVNFGGVDPSVTIVPGISTTWTATVEASFTGCTAGDVLSFKIGGGAHGTQVFRTTAPTSGQYAVVFSRKIEASSGSTISLSAYNETAARGSIVSTETKFLLE